MEIALLRATYSQCVHSAREIVPVDRTWKPIASGTDRPTCMQNCAAHCVCFINAARPCGFRVASALRASDRRRINTSGTLPIGQVHLEVGAIESAPLVAN